MTRQEWYALATDAELAAPLSRKTFEPAIDAVLERMAALIEALPTRDQYLAIGATGRDGYEQAKAEMLALLGVDDRAQDALD